MAKRTVQARIKKPPRKRPPPEPTTELVEPSILPDFPVGSTRYHVEPQTDVGLAVLQSLFSAGAIRITRTEALGVAEPDEVPDVVCPLCETPTKALEGHRSLDEAVCLLCYRAADRLVQKFDDAVRRERDGLRTQLGQLVKDVRSGADEPVFYRGFE